MGVRKIVPFATQGHSGATWSSSQRLSWLFRSGNTHVRGFCQSCGFCGPAAIFASSLYMPFHSWVTLEHWRADLEYRKPVTQSTFVQSEGEETVATPVKKAFLPNNSLMKVLLRTAFEADWCLWITLVRKMHFVALMGKLRALYCSRGL